MNPDKPTPGELRALHIIDRLAEEQGEPPTVRDITRELGAKSLNTAHTYLRGLEKKGLIRRSKYARRSTALTVLGRAEIARAAAAGATSLESEAR